MKERRELAGTSKTHVFRRRVNDEDLTIISIIGENSLARRFLEHMALG